MVMGEAGERLGGDQVVDRQGKDHELYDGIPYELSFSIEAPYPLSNDEAERVAYNAMQEWVNENPDHRVHYIGVSELSDSEIAALNLSTPAYEVTAQVTTSSPQLVAALVVTGIAALASAFGLIYIEGVIVAFIAAYAIFRAVDYILGPTKFGCPKEPEHGTFEGIEDLAMHLKTAHSDQPETNEELVNQAGRYTGMSWKEIAKWGIVGLSIAMVGSAIIKD